jgi:hypothetical protein
VYLVNPRWLERGVSPGALLAQVYVEPLQVLRLEAVDPVRTDTRYQVVVDGDPVAGERVRALAIRLSFRLNSPRYNLGTQESALAVFAHLGRDLRAAGPGPSPGAPTGQARAIARLQMAKLDDLPQV